MNDTTFLSLLGQLVGLLIPIVLPIILAVVGVEFRKVLASSNKLYTSQVSIENRSLINSVIRTGVLAAEQQGLVSKGTILGRQKKEIALQYVQDWLHAHNIPIDVTLLETQIESAVYTEFKKPAPIPAVVSVPVGEFTKTPDRHPTGFVAP